MILKSKKIELASLREEDIAMIAQWRNQPHVRQNLIDQSIISLEQQKKWFSSIDKTKEIYWIIVCDGTPIGLAFCKDINLEEYSFESNIFIGEELALGSTIPVEAALLISALFFNLLGFQKAYSKVMKNNFAAEILDRRLGYQKIEALGEYTRYVSTKQTFDIQAARLLQYFFSSSPLVTLMFDKEDWDYPFLRNIIKEESLLPLSNQHDIM
jgi:UDP-4-amino-4,6-dideoxy-N-acetyl-beta-L-altrosamine N-acetyltransferase